MKRCWKKWSKNLFKIGWIAAAIAISWGCVGIAKAAIVAPPDLSFSITPTEQLSDVYILYDSAVGYGFQWVYGTFSANSTTTANVNLYPAPQSSYNYTIVGVYNSGNDVTVGWSPQSSYLGKDFSQFSSDNLGNMSEQTFIHDIQQGMLSSFANLVSNGGVPFGAQISLVNFSVGADGGHATASPVPIPSPAYLLGPGLGLLLVLRRRSVS